MKATLKRQISGDTNLQFIQDAVQSALDQTTAYVPKTPAKWASPAPTTLFEAIDRLAAVVASLNGSAIP